MLHTARIRHSMQTCRSALWHCLHGGIIVIALGVVSLGGMIYAADGWSGFTLEKFWLRSDRLVGDGEQAQSQNGQTPKLGAKMAKITEYLSRRYRVSQAALTPLVLAAEQYGQAHGLDPVLIIAIMGVESSFNPFAKSRAGAQGLMQVIPRYHTEKISPEMGNRALFDPIENIRVGTLVLKEYMQRNRSLATALQQYNGALDDMAQSYANRILQEKARLEFVARTNLPPLAVENISPSKS